MHAQRRLYLSLLSFLLSLTSYARTYDVAQNGCRGDGKTLNTQPLQQLIDRVSREGGGTVYFPTGTYLSGTLFLKSNVTLDLSAGAVLAGVPDRKAYPQLKSAQRKIAGNFAFLFAEDQENISLTGNGTIDGNGGNAVFQSGKDDAYDRPFLLVLFRCKNVQARDLTLRNSGSWTAHFLDCDEVRVRGLHIWGHSNQNNDGIDIDGCRNVTIADCLLDATDDLICLKAQNRPVQYVTVTNCILATHCNAIKFGTVSDGGFRDITISNIVIRPSVATTFFSPSGRREGIAGIALEEMDGGSLNNVLIQNVVMDSIYVPIFLKLGKRGGAGTFRNVRLQNIVARHAGKVSSSIIGYPGAYVENVTLRDIHISSLGGGTAADADVTKVGENTGGYPDPRWFGGNLPSYGLYVRHVKGLTLDNVQFSLEGDDARAALVLDDVVGAQLTNVTMPETGDKPALHLRNTTNVRRQTLHWEPLPNNAN